MLKISWAETLALLNILSCFRFAYYHWEEKNLNYRVKKKKKTIQPKCIRHIFGLRKVQWVPGIFRISIFFKKTSDCEKSMYSPFPNPLLHHIPRLKLMCKSRVNREVSDWDV